MKAHTKLYTSQFALPGAPTHILSDGSSDFIVYSTGRRAIASLHTVFTMLPRHDLSQIAYLFGYSTIELEYSPNDIVTLDFTLKHTHDEPIQGFVFGIVSKTEMKQIRQNRWDLVGRLALALLSVIHDALPIYFSDIHQDCRELCTSS